MINYELWWLTTVTMIVVYQWANYGSLWWTGYDLWLRMNDELNLSMTPSPVQVKKHPQKQPQKPRWKINVPKIWNQSLPNPWFLAVSNMNEGIRSFSEGVSRGLSISCCWLLMLPSGEWMVNFLELCSPRSQEKIEKQHPRIYICNIYIYTYWFIV